MNIRTTIGAAALATAMVFTTAGACETESGGYASADCDAEDLANFEDDCGYWDTTTGTFVFWYWVSPTYGGYRPSGWKPTVPATGSHKRPPNAKTNSPRVQPKPPNAPTGKPAPTAAVPKYTPPPKATPGRVQPNAPKAPAPAPKPAPPRAK